MEYRKLGKTELDVGVIGLGTEYIWHSSFKIVSEVILEAINNGVNYIDIFMGSPGTRDKIGRVLKNLRQKVLIAGHLGCYEVGGQYAKTRDLKISVKFIDDFYKRLRTDYIDVLYLHNINENHEYDEVFNKGGILDVALDLKRQGKARYIGFSGHKVATCIKAIHSGYIDVIMFPVNPAFDSLPGDINTEGIEIKNSFFEEKVDKKVYNRFDLYKECSIYNIGLVAMKPYAAGHLFSSGTTGSLMPTPVQCLSYALSRPGVATVVPGCKNSFEVKEALKFLNATDNEKECSLLISHFAGKLNGSCMYCNHCQPCPSGIDIGLVTKFVDLGSLRLNDDISTQYGQLEKHASDCKKCKTCEGRCPFGVKVTKNMIKAMKIFGY